MLILFDIDETLVDHMTATRAAATVLHANADSALELDDFLSRWHVAVERHFARYVAGEVSYQEQRRARMREVVDATLTDADADRMFAGYLEVYESSWSLFPDVAPCLDRLSSSYTLGVVSNGEPQHQRMKLASTGIIDRFACIVLSKDCGFAKPASQIFLHACQLAGVRPGDAVHVGDRYDIDAQGAREAGLLGVWLDRGAQATTTHLPPLIATLGELSTILESCPRR